MQQNGPAIGLTVKRVLRRVLRRGSEKGVCRRCLECPLGSRPPQAWVLLSGTNSAHGILHLQNPILGLISGKRI